MVQMKCHPLNKYYAFFVDIKKAFDSIDRSFLIQKLIKVGVNSNLVNALRTLYQNMTMNVNGTNVKTNAGVI